MYVYVPPGYDPARRYPLVIWMHGIGQDEKNFLDLVPVFDAAVANGELPPVVIAAPDGSIRGRPTYFQAGSFFLNSNAGRFEDYLAYDVWNHVVSNFSIRPEREAHVLAGASMGGFAAYNLGIKYRDRFKVIVGIFPPLNLRYQDCHGRYFADFDPNCIGWSERMWGHAVVGRFYGGLITIRMCRLISPLYGPTRNAVGKIASENPVEMLQAYNVQPGELSMFVGYGGKDEFNIDAQDESFVYFARNRGLEVTAIKDPNGRHDMATGIRLVAPVVEWLSPQLKPYAPGK